MNIQRHLLLATIFALGLIVAQVDHSVWAVTSGGSYDQKGPNRSTGLPPAEVQGCPLTPYVAEMIDDSYTSTWFGQDGLMAGTGPSRPGIWYAAPGFMKVQWRRPPGEQLVIEGHRLDGDTSTPPLQVDLPPGYERSDFQSSALTFPTEGCWEVTGKTSQQTLEFVIYVHPGTENPVIRQDPAPAPETFAPLRRQLSLPERSDSGACPRTPVGINPRVLGPSIGDGSIFAQGFGDDGIVRLSDNQVAGQQVTLPIAIRWITNPEITGPLLFRLFELPDHGMGQDPVQPPTVLFEAMHEGLEPISTPDWRVWSWAAGQIGIPGPGCYAIQIDEQQTSHLLIFEVTASVSE